MAGRCGRGKYQAAGLSTEWEDPDSDNDSFTCLNNGMHMQAGMQHVANQADVQVCSCCHRFIGEGRSPQLCMLPLHMCCSLRGCFFCKIAF